MSDRETLAREILARLALRNIVPESSQWWLDKYERNNSTYWRKALRVADAILAAGFAPAHETAETAVPPDASLEALRARLEQAWQEQRTEHDRATAEKAWDEGRQSAMADHRPPLTGFDHRANPYRPAPQPKEDNTK